MEHGPDTATPEVDLRKLVPSGPELPAYLKRHDFLEVARTLANVVMRFSRVDEFSILDVGCGYGRLAAGLLERRGNIGSYVGFDVSSQAIAWCRKVYGAFSSFRFEAVDFANGLYNPDGTLDGTAVDFGAPAPYDMVFSNSLFTHLRCQEAEAYLRAMARVAGRDAVMVHAMFVIDDQARAALEARGYTLTPGGCWFRNPRRPEVAIGHSLAHIGPLLEGLGFVVEVLPGRWSGRADHDPGVPGRGDILVARRRSGP